MAEPSIDYSCRHCGNVQTYRLVPEAAQDAAAAGAPGEIPSIDLRCLRCGASETYKLVPASVHGDAR